jgi:hypothetical protein
MLIAAGLVTAIGALVFAHRGGPPNLQITGKVSGTPTPTAQRPEPSGGPFGQPAFSGSGGWTMSSLPECFHERQRIRGSLAALRAKFPSPAERVHPPAVIVAGDCTIAVRDRELLISRGPDRLRVPPQAFLYRDAGGLTLVYVHGTQAEIRRY